MSRNRDRLSWGHSVVETACPLDCPDACSLAVTVERGRVVKIDGSTRHALTGGYICSKVRHFADRVYGEARLRVPGVRKGPKGSGSFQRVSWDEALDLIASRMVAIRDEWGAEAILPFSYGGSNGLLSQDTNDAQLFRRFGTSRLARTVCAAPTGAAAHAMYGKMMGVAYQDYPSAKLIVVWGANPATSGLHLMPFLKEAREAGAQLVVVDPRATRLARQANLHLPVRPGTDVVVALAVHRYLFESGKADLSFLAAHARGVEELRARAAEWTMERAAGVAGIEVPLLQRFAEMYAALAPAVIRCGWGIERNRNGGNAALAILALPAVAGKFGVRGGGYTMSSSAAWPLEPRRWIEADEPSTRLVNMNRLGRVLTEPQTPPIKMLFVYNCNPVATMPDQNRVIRGLMRDDLFTVVFEQVRSDTTAYADVVLPATTFLETYDIVRGYGSPTLQLARPVIEPLGEARPNVTAFSDLASRLGLRDGAEEDAEALLRVLNEFPADARTAMLDDRVATPPSGPTPIQFVDVFPRTADGRVDLFPQTLAAGGVYVYREALSAPAFPLTLISPASDKSVSSTMAELIERQATLDIHPDDAESRGLEEGDAARVFNELGELHCLVHLTTSVRPGVVSLPKGLWRKSTLNGSTTNALVADDLTDHGGGACFNDTRVEVAKMVTATIERQSVSVYVEQRTIH